MSTPNGLDHDFPGLTVKVDASVLTLALDRPDRLNAVTDAQLHRMAELVETAGPTSRVIVLTGRGRAFCAGADLSVAPDGSDDNSSSAGVETVVAANRLVRAIRNSRLPVIASVNGPVVGVGVSIVLVCDLVVASSTAYFLLPFTSIGLLPDGGATALLAAAIGRSRAMAACLLPERLPALEAHRLGIVHRVVEPTDLSDETSALARRLATGAGAALSATKAAINASTLADLNGALDREFEAQRRLLSTADFAEAVQAFAEKRAPSFEP